MLFVVEKEVDGVKKYGVFEAETVKGAMNAEPMITEDGRPKEPEGKEVAITGVYEVGQVNHLDAISNNFETHRHYRETIEKLGFDPNTYEKLEQEK